MSFKENIDFNSIFVRKRRDKYCVIGQYIGLDGKEKQKTLASCPTQEDAENEKIKIKAAILENRFITSPEKTLYEKYLEYYSDPLKGLSPVTVKNSKTFEKSLSVILNVKLKDVTVAKYKQILNQIFSMDLKESSKNTIMSNVRSVVKECELNEEIPIVSTKVKLNRKRNLAEDVALEDERFCLNEEEVLKVLNYIPQTKIEKKAFLCVHTLIQTGLRFGEMAGLKWESVDFKNKQIIVRNNLQYIDKQFLDLIPKNKKLRTISVSDKLLELYARELEEQKILQKMGLLENLTYVHLNTLLRPLTQPTALKYAKKFMIAAGVEPIGLHALRHTHATMLLNHGVPITVVSKRLGHSSVSLTLDVYSHALKKDNRAAAVVIDSLI